MRKRYIITGANGHLGSTIIRMLTGKNMEVYGLILPGECAQDHDNIRYLHGDVRDSHSLRPLFEASEETEIQVIHTAGVIDISEKGSPLVYQVNIEGTRNMVNLCKEY